jgi:hypothetical protein
MMIRTRLFVSALVLGICTASAAEATTIQIGSAALLGANDFFDWGQVRVVDGTNTAVDQPSPRTVTSGLGRTATVSDGGALTAAIEGIDWFGDFLPGQNVLYSGDFDDPAAAASTITVNFATAVKGLGLQIQSANFLNFSASLEVFDGAASLGAFSVAGLTLGLEDGSAPFLGALSDSTNITSAVFTLTSNTDFGFGVNRLLTADGDGTVPVEPGPAVPEPATLTLVAGGIAVLAARRRRKALR